MIKLLLKSIGDAKPNEDDMLVDYFRQLVRAQSNDSAYLYRDVLWPLLGEHLHARICEASDFVMRGSVKDIMVFDAVASVAAVLNAEHSKDLASLLSESYLLNKMGILFQAPQENCSCTQSLKVIAIAIAFVNFNHTSKCDLGLPARFVCAHNERAT